MGIFTRKIKITAHDADINPAPKSTLVRKVARYNRVVEAQKRAIKRGNVHRAAVLEAEMEALAENLLAEREALESLYRK